MLGDQKLSKRFTRELVNAAMAVCDEINEDLDEFRSEFAKGETPDFKTMRIAAFLPSKHAKRYTVRLLERFKICVQHVAWKIVVPETAHLACTAEELALRAICEGLRMLRDLDADAHKGKRRRPDDSDILDFREAAAEDDDVDFLFAGAVDGLEESETGAELGVANLSFKDWFKPFRPTVPVHPFVAEGSE